MSKQVTVTVLPLCNVPGCSSDAFADAYVPTFGCWGYVCKPHFDGAGCKLGTGRGQELVVA